MNSELATTNKTPTDEGIARVSGGSLALSTTERAPLEPSSRLRLPCLEASARSGRVAEFARHGYKDSVSRLAVIALVALLGCGNDHPEAGSLSLAVRTTVDALSTRDMVKLWATVDAHTQTALLQVMRDVAEARKKVDVVWPEADRARALASLGVDLLDKIGPDDAGRGPRLLAELIDPTKITFTQEILDGLGARDVTVEAGPPERANVFTSVGETFVFVREAGEWRSLFVRDNLLEAGIIPILRENATKTLALAEEREKAWRASIDPRLPQGSYNLARAAQTAKPPDIDALFALIDDDGRKALVEVLEAARAAQRAIQKTVAKPNRREVYGDVGITRLVDATSDRDLYKKWAAAKDFVLPLAVTDEPLRVEGPAEGPDVVVITATGRVPMHRDSDKFWRIAGTRAAIEKGLKPPPQQPKQAP